MATHDERIRSLETSQTRMLATCTALGLCILGFFSYEKWIDIPKHVQNEFYQDIHPETLKIIKDAEDAAKRVLDYTSDLRLISGDKHFVFDQANAKSDEELKKWFTDDEISKAREFWQNAGPGPRTFTIGPVAYSGGKMLSTMKKSTFDKFSAVPEIIISPTMVDTAYSGTPWQLDLDKEKTTTTQFYAKLTIWGPNKLGGFAFKWLAVGNDQ